MYIVSLLFARVGVLKPVTVPEHGGALSWRRHDAGVESQSAIGGACTPRAVRDRRLDNEQTSTSDMHSDTSENYLVTEERS